MDVQIIRHQNRHMLRRLRLYEAAFDQMGLERPRSSVSVSAHPVESTAPAQPEEPPRKKNKKAASLERQYCEICAEQPRRKKEVVIRRCGHAMCKACVVGRKRVRNLHCPFCRVSFSVPGDLQLLAQCRLADL